MRALICIWLLLVSPTSGAEQPGSHASRHRGVCLVGGRSRPTDEALDRLVALGANWISQTPFGWQSRYDDPHLRLATRGRIWWGESDEGLVDTAERARERGLKTILKPHIWLRDRSEGKWRGEIDFDNGEAWDTWWSCYRAFALHYARLAEANGMEMYCIGTELRRTVLEHPDRWRALIDEIRTVYSGQLTYSANWHLEFEEVPFWDALDYIGIQAYFPLADAATDATDLEALMARWRTHVEQIERVSEKAGKPVLFTEVGYRSTRDAAVEPWQWRSKAELDNELQARCYEAMLRTFLGRPWFAGLHIWKWFPDERASERRKRGFTPQGKPAEDVLRAWYNKERHR